MSIQGGPGEERRGTLFPRMTGGPLARRHSFLILTAALLGYTGITALNVLGTGLGALPLTLCLVSLLLIFSLQLRHSGPDIRREPLSLRVASLAAQAILTYGPLLLFKSQWGGMAGFLAGSLLLLLPSRAAWPLYSLVGVSMFFPPAVEHRPLLDGLYLTQSTLLTGLVIYGLSRLVSLIQQLEDTKEQLARMAVMKERLHISRNLHDLLGYSLSAIALKSELIHRLVLSQPQRARSEVQDVLGLARQSLSDVRRVSRGLRDMSLADELRGVTSLLRQSGIDVQVELQLEGVDQAVDAVLAAVVREGITNMLRHSRATRCGLTATTEDGRARLVIVNDGARASQRDTSPHGGAGLENLAARLAEVGGALRTGYEAGGLFRLWAEAPLRPAGPPGAGSPDRSRDTLLPRGPLPAA